MIDNAQQTKAKFARVGENLFSQLKCVAPRELHSGDWEYASKYHFERDRSLSIASRLILYQTLQEILGEDVWDIQLVQSQGKPVLTGSAIPVDLDVNISHTPGLVACVVGYGNNVGIDVEDTSRSLNIDDIAKRLYHPNELQQLHWATTDKQKKQLFFKIWTRKEAFVKALGVGIVDDLTKHDTLVAQTLPASPVELPRLGHDKLAWFKTMELSPSFILSICLAGPKHSTPPIFEIKEISL
ncbi:MAG: 4'-phosphopantetheinyl transferase superfamily protein [Myxococcota bacterium]|nr:4'-phosphopantetheinyl transferase superfamily protein [Myxococcota bacterium]